MGQKQKTPLVACVFYFVLTCISFRLNVNRYTYFLALALHFLSCCSCCCWCPPLPLLCHLLPSCFCALCSKNSFFFAISAIQHFYGEVQRQKGLFFVTAGRWDGWMERNFFIREAAKRQFLIDISMWLLNELKRGWTCRAHYIPEQHRLLCQRKESVPLAERVRKMRKNTCYSALRRGIY